MNILRTEGLFRKLQEEGFDLRFSNDPQFPASANYRTIKFRIENAAISKFIENFENIFMSVLSNADTSHFAWFRIIPNLAIQSGGSGLFYCRVHMDGFSATLGPLFPNTADLSTSILTLEQLEDWLSGETSMWFGGRQGST